MTALGRFGCRPSLVAILLHLAEARPQRVTLLGERLHPRFGQARPLFGTVRSLLQLGELDLEAGEPFVERSARTLRDVLLLQEPLMFLLSLLGHAAQPLELGLRDLELGGQVEPQGMQLFQPRVEGDPLGFRGLQALARLVTRRARAVALFAHRGEAGLRLRQGLSELEGLGEVLLSPFPRGQP